MTEYYEWMDLPLRSRIFFSRFYGRRVLVTRVLIKHKTVQFKGFALPKLRDIFGHGLRPRFIPVLRTFPSPNEELHKQFPNLSQDLWDVINAFREGPEAMDELWGRWHPITTALRESVEAANAAK